jgi:acid phosphatase type 7
MGVLAQAVNPRHLAPRAAVVLASIVPAAWPAPRAEAAYPGANGSIVYETRTSAAKGVLYSRAPGSRRATPVRAVRGARDAVFSPQGRRIALAARGSLWVMQADGKDLRSLSGGRRIPAREPTWSPAGDELAFAGGPRGRRDIFRIGAAGGAPVRMASSRADERSPAWSADGEIAFVRSTRAGGDELYAVDPRTAATRRLTRSRPDEADPSWSPDGTRIAFTRRRAGARDLYVMSADGTRARRLTRGRVVSAPAWSPDGRRIVFAMVARDRRQLFTIGEDESPRQLTRSRSAPDAPDWEPAGGDPVIAAAGDIACDPADGSFRDGFGTAAFCRQRATSDLLLGMDLSAVLVPGDAQYNTATLPRFLASFDPSWGRLRSLLRPAPGNHEYRDPGAAGYFDYFNGRGRPDGPAGRRDRGYYSFDVGGWHVVSLNSQCSHPPANPTLLDCAAGSAQESWLRADLAANPAACTLAFWHHPTASSGILGRNAAVEPLLRALHEHDVDVLLTGHDHAYERFAPKAPGHVLDPDRGIREFVVGTGGRSLQVARTEQVGSEVRAAAYGVLRMTLRAGAYDWAFVPQAGGTFSDSGSERCH